MGLKRTTKTSLVFLSFKNFKNFLSFKSFHSFQHTPKLQTELSKRSLLVTKEKLLPCSKVAIALFMLAGNILYLPWTAVLAFSR